MSEPILKHSRLPRKQELPAKPARKLTVAKRPLSHLSEEQRAKIAAEVLDRYLAGEQVADIAPEYETSDVTIYALLLREHEADWKDIQEARALARLERAQSSFRDAPDALSLAKAREEVRSAQWELERLCKRLYGQEQQNTNQVVHPVLIIATQSELTAQRAVSLAPAHERLVIESDTAEIAATQQNEQSST